MQNDRSRSNSRRIQGIYPISSYCSQRIGVLYQQCTWRTVCKPWKQHRYSGRRGLYAGTGEGISIASQSASRTGANCSPFRQRDVDFSASGRTVVVRAEILFETFKKLAESFGVSCNYVEADSYEAVLEKVSAKGGCSGQSHLWHYVLSNWLH